MPVPSPRNSIRIARGNYADLAANATEIGEGELCFAIDQDRFYSKSGGSLVAVGGGTELYSIQQLGDVDVTGVVNGQVLSWNGTTWVPSSTSGAPVDSVNGQTGVVVLTVSDLDNDANYITAAEAPVQPGDVFSGDYNDLTNQPSIPSSLDDLADVNAPSPSSGQFLQWSGSSWTPGAASGAPVDSVNGQTGAVVLDAADVGAATAAQGTTADSAIQPGTVNPVYFANQAAFPDATANHGAIAHSHADGAMFFAHNGVWNQMANSSDVFSGDYNDLSNQPTIPPAFDGGAINSSITSPEETITAGAWDLSAGNFWTAGAITVPNPTNAVAGMSGLIRLTAAPTGWGTNIKHPGGSAESISSFPAVVPFYVESASVILLGKATQGIA